MPIYVEAFIVASGLVCLWYAIRSWLTIRSSGLDPSLVTYLSPLLMRNYWVARLMMLIVAASALISYPHRLIVLLIPALLVVFSIAQFALLIGFGRTGTQPTTYYASLAAGGFVAMSLEAYAPIAALFVIIIPELLLRNWIKNKDKIYNRWVAKKVAHIHRNYVSVAVDCTGQEWFYVLHFAVTESIARPRVSRLVEFFYFHIKHPATISSGIMQVQADRLLTDLESVQRGSHIIRSALSQMPPSLVTPPDQLKWLAQIYNGSLNARANDEYTGYLRATYPGVLEAWKSIHNSATFKTINKRP